MKQKHTKGPWSTSMFRTPDKPLQDGMPATIYGYSDGQAFEEGDEPEAEIAEMLWDSHGSKEEAWANANLMAAGPEMLRALRSARETIISAVQAGCDLPDFDPAQHVTVVEIDAAIAKATGQASD